MLFMFKHQSIKVLVKYYTLFNIDQNGMLVDCGGESKIVTENFPLLLLTLKVFRTRDSDLRIMEISWLYSDLRI